MNVTKEDIVGFLSDDLAINMDGIDAQSLLFSTGIIDSFSLISLISFLEEKCGLRMSPSDVILDNLDSIDKMLAFVARASEQS